MVSPLFAIGAHRAQSVSDRTAGLLVTTSDLLHSLLDALNGIFDTLLCILHQVAINFLTCNKVDMLVNNSIHCLFFGKLLVVDTIIQGVTLLYFTSNLHLRCDGGSLTWQRERVGLAHIVRLFYRYTHLSEDHSQFQIRRSRSAD